MAIIELKNVTETYEAGEHVTPIEDINLSINKGDYLAISGESGIGKSTLLTVAGGLLRPTKGKVLIDGRDYWQMSDQEQTQIRNQKIGYLFQSVQLVQALSVEENLELAAKISKKKVSKKEIRKMLAQFGLEEKKDSLPHQLSGGQKRRVMLAVTYVRDPEVILADEPTNDLDDGWTKVVMDTFAKWAEQGKAVVLVTHDQKLWTQAARTYVIEDRKLNNI